jgi:N-acetylglucosaminyl-diphospho-decaprenol L-rhamnosyltransferase
VVVAHARLDLAQRCVVSLRQWLPRERILVVLNLPAAADGESTSIVEREACLMSPPAPQGYGANVNLGVRSLAADLDFCVLANDDVVFEAESLPRMLDVLRCDETVGIVGAKLIDPDGSDATSYAEFPRLADAVRDIAILPRPLWRSEQRKRAVRRGESRIDFVVGAAVVVRVPAFRAVGGFDEDFFLNYEETDLCYRLRLAGWTVAWCRDAVVTHQRSGSISPELNRASLRAGRRLYFEKRLGPVRWALFKLVLFVVFGLGLLYSIAASLVRPRTAHHRYTLVRQGWRNRLFLVP